MVGLTGLVWGMWRGGRVASAAGSETRAPGALGLGVRGWVRLGNGQDLQDGRINRIVGRMRAVGGEGGLNGMDRAWMIYG